MIALKGPDDCVTVVILPALSNGPLFNYASSIGTRSQPFVCDHFRSALTNWVDKHCHPSYWHQKEKQRKLPSAALRLVPSPRYFATLLKRSQLHYDWWHVRCQLRHRHRTHQPVPLHARKIRNLARRPSTTSALFSETWCDELSCMTIFDSQILS